MFGKNFILLSYKGRECDVEPYTETYDAIKNIPIVSAATAWTADGHKASMAANTIAINMFAQVDEDGNRHVLFDEITDHMSDELAVKHADAFIANKSDTKRQQETTKGWELLV